MTAARRPSPATNEKSFTVARPERPPPVVVATPYQQPTQHGLIALSLVLEPAQAQRQHIESISSCPQTQNSLIQRTSYPVNDNLHLMVCDSTHRPGRLPFAICPAKYTQAKPQPIEDLPR
ncbi:hypothetical protein DBV39_11400 [Orrella marina]|uniref:Uncharacterized protein n=1 Tax=Orrella marina TaxID=2163011 RepID=A0A2R4XK98_9BURK|nr:hypothetical protein DBV39_11400 [Orrella marina]